MDLVLKTNFNIFLKFIQLNESFSLFSIIKKERAVSLFIMLVLIDSNISPD
jgi:hypothetical protein